MGLSTVIVLSGCESTPTTVDTTIKTLPTTPEASDITVAIPLSANEISHYEQSLDYLYIQQYSEAEKILVPLTKKHPQHFGAWMNLATTYYGQDNFVAAQQASQRALKINDSEPDIHNLIGLLAIENKEYKDAEKEYLLAIKLAPKFAMAHYNLALLYDIFYQDIPAAYKHYNLYLENIQQEDAKTKEWVEQLKYSLGSN